MLLIKKTVSQSNQPPLSERDLGERAMDWMEALEENIPVDRLTDAYSRALKTHTGTFPINAFEIIANYKELVEQEAAAKAEIVAELKNRPENRVANCSQKRFHIDGNGMVKVVNPFNFNEEIDLPCRECRSEAYYDQREMFIHKHGRIEPLEVLNNFVNFQEFKNNK